MQGTKHVIMVRHLYERCRRNADLLPRRQQDVWTHCGLEMPYFDMDLGQQWLR